MNYFNIIILQFIAHILTDFTFQSNKWAKDKIDNGFKSKSLKSHLIIYFLLSWIFSLQWNFVIVSLVLTLAHYIIDGFKKTITNNNKLKNAAFFIDQSLHILSIAVIVTLFFEYIPINPVIHFTLSTKILLIAAAYLLCTKPANIIIKEILNDYNINTSKEGTQDIPNVGKLIGNVERILALTLILNGQYESVGFIIAAKSILRFKDSDTAKTEYVLVGTLLSFGIAVILGILLQFVK